MGLKGLDCASHAVCAAGEHRALPRKKPPVGQKSLGPHPRRGSPLYTAPQILLRGPTRPFAELSDSIVPEALLSDGQGFVRVSRSSALIQMIARLDEVLISC